MEKLSETALSVKAAAKLGVSRAFKIVLWSGTVQINLFFLRHFVNSSTNILHVTVLVFFAVVCLFLCFLLWWVSPV